MLQDLAAEGFQPETPDELHWAFSIVERSEAAVLANTACGDTPTTIVMPATFLATAFSASDTATNDSLDVVLEALKTAGVLDDNGAPSDATAISN